LIDHIKRLEKGCIDRPFTLLPQSSTIGITEKTQDTLGFCIRTGKKIPFNPDRPFSKEAFDNWSIYSNEDYPEKYCHFSGEESFGETTYDKPIMRKNWKKAKEIHNL
jgi:hypothetical protein